jgi:outer membrane lipoprotein LolB
MPQWSRWRPTLILLLGCILLSACSTRISVPEGADLNGDPPTDWAARKQALLAFDQWRLMGKIAVRQSGQSESAIINRWRQDESAYRLQLSSAFLGMGSVQLKGDSGYLLIRTGDGERYLSDDPETLVLQVTGWRLPLSALPYWVRGIPAPNQDAELGFGAEGQLKMLLQSGWEVHFQRYSELVAGQPPLPTLITATNGEARVRLAISDWQAGLQD